MMLMNGWTPPRMPVLVATPSLPTAKSAVQTSPAAQIANSAVHPSNTIISCTLNHASNACTKQQMIGWSQINQVATYVITLSVIVWDVMLVLLVPFVLNALCKITMHLHRQHPVLNVWGAYWSHYLWIVVTLVQASSSGVKTVILRLQALCAHPVIPPLNSTFPRPLSAADVTMVMDNGWPFHKMGVQLVGKSFKVVLHARKTPLEPSVLRAMLATNTIFKVEYVHNGTMW